MRQVSDSAKARRRIPGGPKTWQRAATLLLSALGTGVFQLLDLPLPFLFGPMLACLLAALAGAPLAGMGPVSKGARTILGVAVGASVTPSVVHQLPQMVGSVAFVPLYVLVIGCVGVPFFHKVCGFDRATAYFAAMPGGLQDMVIFGTEAGADMRALALIHATRVLVIVSLVPVIIVHGFGVPFANPIGEPATSLPLDQMALMVVLALVGWKGGERIGLFGATILGPLILTAPMAIAGVIEHRPPAEAINAAQFFIGAGVGVGYVGVTLAELRKHVAAGILYVFILAALTFAFTEIVVQAGFAEPMEGFLAFAPGGQAEMTVLAIISGADLGFVVVHHLLRIMIVITGAPLVAHFAGIKGR